MIIVSDPTKIATRMPFSHPIRTVRDPRVYPVQGLYRSFPMQRDWLNYLMEASTTGRPGASAQEASGASPGLGRAFPPEEQEERHLVRGNVFIHQGAAPPSAASMPLAPSSCQQPTPDGRAAANSSTAPVGNPQRINPASYASLGLSGLSAAALLASRGQEQGEMQPQQAQGASRSPLGMPRVCMRKMWCL